MEYAVYRIFRDERGRKMGTFVNMLSSRGEAEELAGRLEGEHEVVELRTREIGEDDDYSTVLFSDESDVAALGGRKRGVRDMNERQTRKGVAGYVESLSLEEVERELRALREHEDAELTPDEAILAGIYTAKLEAARERKLRERRVDEAADPQPGEREEE